MLQRSEAAQEGLANPRFIAPDPIQKDHRPDRGRQKKQDQAAKTSGQNQQRTELAQLRIHPLSSLARMGGAQNPVSTG